MNIRRVLRLGAVAAWMLAIAPITGTFGASASGATLDAQGWWNKSQALPVQGNPSGIDDPTGNGLTTAPTVPPPATVPADGLYVSGDGSADGSAISAVRYRLAGQGGGTLTLKLPSGSKLTGTESVVACPIVGGFTPAQNGRWDSKPGYEATSCAIKGEPSSDGTSMSFAVPATLSSALGDISIVLVPEAGSTPFTLAFEKPADDSFTVTTPVQSQPAAPVAAPYEPGSAVYTPPAASSAPAFAAPPAADVTAPSSTGGGDQAPAAPVALAEPVSKTSEGRTVQVMAVGLMVAIGAAMWWLASQPQRAPRLLGSLGGAKKAEAEVSAITRTTKPRGIGRFARHREAPPTAI